MWGSPAHMGEVERGVCAEYPEHEVMNCNKVSFFATFQGVDNCGWRLYDDIICFVNAYDKKHGGKDSIRSISFIGYSLGGLICRYCIGLLDSKSFFQTVRPVHLVTIATPHLGTRLRHRSFSGRAINYMGSALVGLYAGRSGRQLALIDGDAQMEPLLLEMTRPQSVYMTGLKKFAHIFVYANASNDNTVPYSTSSLSYRNKWKAAASSQAVSGGSDSSFILELESIRGDTDAADHAHKHLVKQLECSLCDVVFLVGVLLLGFPLLVLHVLLLAFPARLVSLLYSFPDKSNLCQRLQLEVQGVVDPDLCPWLILKNLREHLDIHRISVKIPGAHTHGKIICRFQQNPGGLDVIRHLVKEVLPLRDGKESNPLDGEVTEMDVQLEMCSN